MEKEIEAEIALEEVNVLRKGCEKKKHIEKITHVAVLIHCLVWKGKINIGNI